MGKMGVFGIINGKIYATSFRRDHYLNRKPPISDIEVWFKFLECYDLRTRNNLALNVIAEKVFPTDKEQALYRVNRAIGRFRSLIRSAEKGPWPPKTNTSVRNLPKKNK